MPVLTAAVGGNEEIIHNAVNGYIYDAKKVMALARILEAVYLGKYVITDNTRTAIVAQFSIEEMINQHFKTLSEFQTLKGLQITTPK